MKRVLRITGGALLAFAMVAGFDSAYAARPSAGGGRPSAGGSSSSSMSRPSRPSSSSQSSFSRPTNVSRPTNTESARPSRPSSSSVERPSTSNSHNSRPSMGGGNVERPSRPNSSSTSARPSVNERPSRPSNSDSRPSATERPSRPNTSTTARPNVNERPSRPNTGTTARPNVNERPSKPNTGVNERPSRPSGDKPNGGNHGGFKPGGNGNHGGVAGPHPGHATNHGRPNLGGGGFSKPNHGGRPSGNTHIYGGKDRPGVVAGGKGHKRPKYGDFRFSKHGKNRPNLGGGRGARFFDIYRNNSWSWRTPMAPPIRHRRPATVWYYRPVVPSYYSYYSLPVIAGVMGLEFGVRFAESLNYLYYNDYDIDGYEDNVVYLRDVTLMDYTWEDAMLQYDNDRLVYAQYSSYSDYDDYSRFESLYGTLCEEYGEPIDENEGMYCWYGGDGVGFVNLGYYAGDNGGYYTTLAFGSNKS